MKDKTMTTPKHLVPVIQKLQQLREIGNDDKAIEKIIHSLNLPFREHMFILGNFSEIMELEWRS